MKLGFIGGGNMAAAMIGGLLQKGFSASDIRVAEPQAERRAWLSAEFGVAVEESAAGCLAADVVVLAVKPQQLPEVLATIAPAVTARHVVISIAAGISLRWLQRRLPRARLVRVMPNLPATVRCGFSALSFGAHVRAQDRRTARAIFEAVGEVCELPERHLDAITAVSGSGPAYVFFLIQAWQAAARRLKLPPAVAQRAIVATLRGGLALFDAAQEDPAALIAQVASKKGTTEAALKVLARRRVAAHFVEAVQAAAARSRALAWS
jgi:pyrroline-5-carboxylate reductase